MKRLEEELEEFANTIRGLSTEPDHPKTAFELLDRGRYEEAWQSYLQYFLDPDESHQLNNEFLVQFFELLEDQEAISFSPPKTGLQSGQNVEVKAERQSNDDNRPDLIITSGSEWFLCIELKVHAPEGGGFQPQTIRYADDSGIVPDGVSSYEENDYLYIKPATAPSSTSEKFSDLAWQDVQSAIDETIAQSTGHIPTRSLAQLSDFSKLINSQLSMTDVDEDTRQRKDLYFRYREEITEAQEAIGKFVERILQQKWSQALQEEYTPNNTSKMEWQYDAVGEGYGQVRVPRWKTAKSGPAKLDIHWEHKPKKDDFKKGQVRFLLELEEPNSSTITNSSPERYQQFRRDIISQLSESVNSVAEPRWEEFEETPSSSKKKLARFDYEFQPGDEEGYYQCLQFALEDTQAVTELVTDLLEANDYANYQAE